MGFKEILRICCYFVTPIPCGVWYLLSELYELGTFADLIREYYQVAKPHYFSSQENKNAASLQPSATRGGKQKCKA